MMMIRVLFWLMAVATVVGCQVEDTETSGTLNVDPNSEEEVPEWVTASYLDLNKDGVVDIKDLVIMSKFFGQEVPEGEVASASGESNPCLDIERGVRVPQVETVEDNANFKETFDAPEGGKYVYALLGMLTWHNIVQRYPICVAVRMLVDNSLSKEMVLPKKIKIKPVAQYKTVFSDSITSPLLEHWDNNLEMNFFMNLVNQQFVYHYSERNREGRRDNIYAVRTMEGVSPSKAKELADIGFAEDYTPNFKADFKLRIITKEGAKESLSTTRWRKAVHGVPRMLRKAIPISDNIFIQSFSMLVPKDDELVTYRWGVDIEPASGGEPFNWDATWGGRDQGAYVKMLPSEVRRRYFREDIE